MRIAYSLILSATLALWVAGGCARPTSLNMAPTQDEMPHLAMPERVLPVSVGVEGRREEPFTLLVTDYKPPELTPEERTALGIEPETINWLEFYRPTPIGRICSGNGGVSAGVHGLGGPGTSLIGFTRMSFIGSGDGGVATGVHGEHTGRYGLGFLANPAGHQGSEDAAVRVGVGPAGRISTHQTRPEP
jgi:hypothetical protein